MSGKEMAYSPEEGDLKVRFDVIEPGPYSILAVQQGDTFVPYITSRDTEISMLMTGIQSSTNMFTEAHSSNNTLTWILRGVGLLMMLFGLSIVFSPLVVLADVIPFTCNLLGSGVFLFSLVTSLSLGTIVIA